MQSLNFAASAAFYGSLVAFAFIAIALGFATKWIVDAWLLNRRMNAWLRRLNGYPQSAERACFKASRYAK
jgi:hypothetical protein